MFKHPIISKLLVSSVFVAISSVVLAAQQPIIWEATFHDVMPKRSSVSMAYCKSHSPDVFRTTVKNILSKGAKAHNGVLVKYKDYDQDKENGLYFIEVDAVMSGVYRGKPWSSEMYLHEQKLTPNGVTDVVWSDDDCKGKFTGKAINLH